MAPSQLSIDNRHPFRTTSGSTLPWFILCIAAIICGIALALWRMRSVSTAPQPSEQTPFTAAQFNEVQSLIDGLAPIPVRNFLMVKTEVTETQWDAVMGADTNRTANPGLPVSGVSWNDCQEFLKKLNEFPAVKDAGLTFRLPTEEEWVFACRAGASGRFGKRADGTEITEDNIGDVAWIDDNSGKRTHPVGQREPNAFGLYDMHGNVWEWCQDEFGEVSPWAQGHEHDRIYRGGSWLSQAWLCMTSSRRWGSPDVKEDYIGFRLCADKR